jgi:hypothetical protein
MPLCWNRGIEGYNNPIRFLLPDDLEEHVDKPVYCICRKSPGVRKVLDCIVSAIHIGIAVNEIKVHGRLYPCLC